MPEVELLPFVTVIMPVRNEAAHIASSLGAVLDQDYPPERFEVLVADGQSTDGTAAVIRGLRGADRVTIVPNPQRLQSAGINVALRVARGDIIIRVDGHTIIERDYIQQCVRALRGTGAQNVGGSIRPMGRTAKSKAIASAARSQFAVPGAFHLELPKDAPGRDTDTVYMGAWPREVFARVGGFNDHLAINEDYELNYRIRKSGGRIYFSPAIRSTYYSRENLPALAKQYFRYGKGKVQALRVSPGALHVRHLVPPVFVGALLIGIPLAVEFPLARIIWGAVVGLYCVLAVLFGVVTVREMPAIERSSVAQTALVFPVMHVSWGLGFWVGMLSRKRRPRTTSPLLAQPTPQPGEAPTTGEMSALSDSATPPLGESLSPIVVTVPAQDAGIERHANYNW